MAGRPRLQPGEWGEISFTKLGPKRVRARAKFCDHDGNKRDMNALGSSQNDAKRSLVARFAPTYMRDGGEGISASMKINDLFETWKSEVESQRDIPGVSNRTETTLVKYYRAYNSYARKSVGNLTIGQITVSRLDGLISDLITTRKLSNARDTRIVLKQMFDLAVRHDARMDNPVERTRTVPKRKLDPRALSVPQVLAIRQAVREWDAKVKPGPKSGYALNDVFEMLFMGLRIGEALGIRWEDVDFDYAVEGVSGVGVTVSGTTTGEGPKLLRQNKPKTPASFRKIMVTQSAADMLRRKFEGSKKSGPVFVTRNGTLVSSNNARRSWRAVRSEMDFAEFITPHTFRRTAATLIEREYGSVVAARFLGHTNDSVTREHYIERAAAAPVATSAFGQLEEDQQAGI